MQFIAFGAHLIHTSARCGSSVIYISFYSFLCILYIIGVVTNVNERCEIYRERIRIHYENVIKAQQAKERNEKKAEVHAEEKLKVKALMSSMAVKQCW